MDTVVDESDQIPDFQARYELAMILFWQPGAEQELTHHLSILEKEAPHHSEVALLIARWMLRQKEYSAADRYVEIVRANDRIADANTLINLGGMEAELGNAQASAQLFARAAPLVTPDTETFFHTHYAKARELWGDWLGAEKILRPLALENKTSEDDLLRLVELYSRSAQVVEAIEVARKTLAAYPHSRALLELIHLHIQLKQFDSAWEELSCAKQIPTLRREAQILQAQLTFTLGHYEEAQCHFISLAQTAEIPFQQADFLAQAGISAWRSSDCDTANRLFQQALHLNPPAIVPRFYLALMAQELCELEETLFQQQLPPQELHAWALCFQQEGSVSSAISLLEYTCDTYPGYFPAFWDLANLYSVNYWYDSALCIYLGLQELFPDSEMIALQIARVLSWKQCYTASLSGYDALIQAHCSPPIFTLEKARVALWSKRPCLSWDAYCTLLDDPYAPHTYLEMEAKFSDWSERPLRAVCWFEALLEADPGNMDARFQLGQLKQRLGAYAEAREEYEEILRFEPLYTTASKALDRLNDLSRPALIINGSYWREQGYGGLSEIVRSVNAWGIDYAPCEQTHLQLKHCLFVYHPLLTPPKKNFTTQGIELGFRHVWGYWGALQAAWIQKFGWSAGTPHRPIGKVTLSWRPCDRLLTAVGVEQADELYNFFGIRQGTQSRSIWGQCAWTLTRKGRVDLNYRYLNYTDHNAMHYAVLNGTYQFTEHPCILRGIVSAEYRNTNHISEFIYVGPTLVNIIYPYWSPQDYWAGRLNLEWEHDLTTRNFEGAEKQFYLIRAMVGTDSENNPAAALNIDLHVDCGRRWSMQFSGLVHYSRLWRASGLWAGINYAF